MLGIIVLATFIISLISFVGVFALSFSKERLNKILLLLVALAAGTLIGNVFFHLLPESVELLPPDIAFLVVLLSFVLFFFIEKALHWHHCHQVDHSHHKTFGYMNLIGDVVHNFTDGLVIAAAFIASPVLGVTTSIAVALHEIPQEIGDFGVLVYSGFSRVRALFLNFVVALGALVGAVVGYFLLVHIPSFEAYLIPIAAGGFLYIGASDLLPEIRQENKASKVVWSFIAFVLGIVLMFVLVLLAPEHSHAEADLHDHSVEEHAGEM